MSRFRDRPFFRLALIGTLAASLGLAACGRKGPLDPPPGASLANEPQAEAQTTPGSMTMPIGGGGQSRGNALATDASGRPLAPPGEKKRIPLDVLLN